MWGAQLYSEPLNKYDRAPTPTLYEGLTHEFARLFLVALILYTYTYMGPPTWPVHAHASRCVVYWLHILYVEVET